MHGKVQAYKKTFKICSDQFAPHMKRELIVDRDSSEDLGEIF